MRRQVDTFTRFRRDLALFIAQIGVAHYGVGWSFVSASEGPDATEIEVESPWRARRGTCRFRVTITPIVEEVPE